MKNLAIIFPGQGSQSVGMLQDLMTNNIVKKTFDEAGEALGYDMADLVLNDTDNKLNQTIYTQPVMLCSDIAIYRMWLDKTNLKPNLLAGHSLGEYAAVVASEVIDFKSAIILVKKRAEYMQNAVPDGIGAMAAIIGLKDDDIINFCQQENNDDNVVEAVNFNAPGQVVIAGHKNSVIKVMEQCKTSGAKITKLLPVSVPSHCSLMKDAATKLSDDMDKIEFKSPQIKIIHNVNADIAENSSQIKLLLAKQLYSPVVWVDVMQKINLQKNVVEAGPGKVLTNLNKRIDKTVPVHPIYDLSTFNTTLEKIL
ncbi:MAG: [acyl-carrier-protein] S-malonyltransferase [Gammaproteobacteria bacterium]|nr:MAG: [acyl-carrier-protein] S-malonyltransferase [Gammaproteobacteria bacterium]